MMYFIKTFIVVFLRYINLINWITFIPTFIVVLALVLIAKKLLKKDLKAYKVILLVLYFSFLLTITVFGREKTQDQVFDVFLTYKSLFTRQYMYGVMEVVINVLLFIPFGIIVCSDGISAVKSIAVFLIASLVIEALQLIFSIGGFEVCDLINNTAGGLIGFYLMKLFTRKKRAD